MLLPNRSSVIVAFNTNLLPSYELTDLQAQAIARELEKINWVEKATIEGESPQKIYLKIHSCPWSFSFASAQEYLRQAEEIIERIVAAKETKRLAAMWEDPDYGQVRDREDK